MPTPTERAVTLVFDPFGICGSPGLRVDNFQAELMAFGEIDRRLRMRHEDEAAAPITVVIAGGSMGHFEAYRGVRGVFVEDLTPVRRVAEMIGEAPPPWLSDAVIVSFGLLAQKPPIGIILNSWEATVLEWLSPGLARVRTLTDWLRVACATPVGAAISSCEPMANWVLAQLHALSAPVISSPELLGEFLGSLSGHQSPAGFAREWLRRVAFLPLLDPKVNNRLRAPELSPLGPRDRLISKQLPLVFPAPAVLYGEIAARMVEAVRRARNASPFGFEEVVLGLNALWDGVWEELLAWLDVEPRGMTLGAWEHLTHLPGYDVNDPRAQVALGHVPPSPVSPWGGIDATFDHWIGSYSKWARSSFVRRELPTPSTDPSAPFARWLKDNCTVTFAHPERSYLTLASRVRNAMQRGRIIILVVIDALAVHVSDVFVEQIATRLAAEPTFLSHIFTPIPTVTEVCKSAIVTGQYPDHCTGDLATDIKRAFQLREEQLTMVANWNDAMRVRVSSQMRLLVYRENRLDNYLGTTGSYKELICDARALAEKVASLLKRLVDDVRCVAGAAPLLMITGDHGFTYGPTPGQETSGKRQLDGSHRCVAINDELRGAERYDESVTYIDHSIFHTRSDYIAAKGRSFGSGTLSGWKLSHGGLLPEEVIVPTIEWFGDEAAVVWPRLEPAGEAIRDRGAWVFRLRLQNIHTAVVPGGELAVSIPGAVLTVRNPFSRLQPGQAVEIDFVIPTDAADGDNADVLNIDTLTSVWLSADKRPVVPRSLQVRKAQQLTERTSDQDAFESMF